MTLRATRFHSLAMITVTTSSLLLGVVPIPATAAAEPTLAAVTVAEPLDESAILAAQKLDEPQWYRDNIPFIDTPDDKIDAVYYYRWSTYKRALRYTVPGTGYVSTEYDVPIGYSGNPYTALPDATGYHLTDGRWAADQSFAGDYLDFYLNGAGVPGTQNFSEWIVDAAYQRSLVTGDRADMVERLPDLVALYNRWNGRLDSDIGVNGQPSTSDMYWQTPLSDATEFTETSMKSADWFGGGAGYRPTINAYMYGAATAISTIAAAAGQPAVAADFTNRAAALKTAVQTSLWDPQRNFFFQVYNQQDGSNGGLKGTRTTWRELMGYAPWAYNLPDPQYSSAWQYLTKPEYFGAAHGPTTLERFHDLEAEQATINQGNTFNAVNASNGSYVGQLDFPSSSVSFAVDAPGAGTYPVRVFYANGTNNNSTHLLTVNGSTTPITVTYPSSGAWRNFSSTQFVTVDVPMNAGRNVITLAKGDSYAEIDKIQANPYFNFQAIPAQPNREDQNCCHWNGPTWPYQTSQVLNGLANVLTNYPAQNFVTAADYREQLADFTNLQFKDSKPYVAEAADGDTGNWIYDGFNFSENYNHSSYIDLVLSGLLGVKPQADDTLVLKPLVDPTWDHFAVQNVTYHGHKLSIVYDKDGSHYGQGAGLKVYQDGALIHSSATLPQSTTIPIGTPVTPPATQKLVNVIANPLTMEQDWLNRPITQLFPKAFASYTNTVSNGPRCHSGQTCRPTTFDQPMRATDGWIRYDKIPDNRWTNAGSPNTTDNLGVDLGAARPLRQLSVYTYDDGDTVRTPASFDAQYLDGQTWRSIPGQTKSPTAPRANDVNTIDFPTVVTSQVRVVFTPQPGKFVGVTELQSWYPESPAARIINKNSGLELATATGSLPYGNAVTQQAANGDQTHRWSVVPAEDGYYKIVNEANGFVLGIRDAATNAGADGLLWVDNLSRDHLWSIVDAGNGWSKLINANSGLALGVDQASAAAGAKTVQWGDTGTSDHLWRLAAADGPTTYAVQNQATGMNLAVQGASNADGAAIVVGNGANTTDQRWTLAPLPNGTVQIVNLHSGKILAVNGTQPAVVQTTAVDTPGTRWHITAFGDGYQRLVNVASNLALTVDSGASPGAAVTQQTISGATTQRWQLTVGTSAAQPAAATITALAPSSVATDAGLAPVLPTTVAASYSDGSTAQVPVTWAAVAPAAYATPGTSFTVSGTVAATALTATVTVTVTDGTAPALTVTVTPAEPDGLQGWWKTAVDVTAAATDESGTAPVIQLSRDGGITWDAYAAQRVPEGTTTLQYRAADASGNVSSIVEKVVKIDTIAPLTGAVVDAPGRKVALSATDHQPGSGVQRVEYRVDAGTWTATDGAQATATVGAAAATVQYRSVDVAGNVSSTGTASVPASDTPAVAATVALTSSDTPTSDGWYTADVLVTITAPAGTVAQYRLDGGAWRNYARAFTITTNAAHVLDHRLTRNSVVVANSAGTEPVKLDKIVPVASAVRVPSTGLGTPRNPVTLSFNADDTLSGLEHIEYQVNQSAWTPVDRGQALTFDTIGDRIVSYRSFDVAGNVSVIKTTSVKIAADTATTVKPSATTVAAGGFLTLTLAGFDRFDTVAVELGTVTLGSVFTDVNGAARVTLQVPAAAALGAAAVTAKGSDGNPVGIARVTVR